MFIKPIRFFLMIAFAVIFSASAKENPVIDQIQSEFQNIKTIKTDFEQTARSTRFGEKKSGGELLIKRPGQMLWSYSSPKGRVFAADGGLITLYDPESKQALVSKQPKGAKLPAGFSFLMGQGKLSEFFNIEILKDGKNKAGHREVTILCKSKTNDFEFKTLELTFAWAPQIQLASSKTVDMLDSENEIHFSNMKFNTEISSKVFDVKLPKGIPVVSADSIGIQ